jgi:hypothetical protein
MQEFTGARARGDDADLATVDEPLELGLADGPGRKRLTALLVLLGCHLIDRLVFTRRRGFDPGNQVRWIEPRKREQQIR